MTHTTKLSGASIVVLFAGVCGMAVLLPVALISSTARPDLAEPETAFLVSTPPEAANRVYTYSHSLARPLFHPDRKPPLVDVANLPTPPAITLEGIVGGPNGRVAGLRLHEEDKVRWLRTGAPVEDWVVERIYAKSVKLSRDGDVLEVALRRK